MKPKKKMDTFATVMLVAFSQANLLMLIWTIWLTAEQIRTGWGWGTGIEMLAIALWMAELLCLPVLLAGLVYAVMCFYRKQSRGLLIANIALFVCLVAQIAVTNLFLFY